MQKLSEFRMPSPNEESVTRPFPKGIRPPPPGCRVVVEEQPDGITITVPPHGLVGGGGGVLVFFTLLWIGITIFVTASCYSHAPNRGGVPSPLARYLGPLVFWASSIGLVLVMVNLGR